MNGHGLSQKIHRILVLFSMILKVNTTLFRTTSAAVNNSISAILAAFMRFNSQVKKAFNVH